MLAPDKLNPCSGRRNWRLFVLPLFEIGRVLVGFDHVASLIVNANHSVMRPVARLCVVNCVAHCVWLTVPQPTEWQPIGNQIDAATILRGRTA
jgi:hypothetical protein